MSLAKLFTDGDVDTETALVKSIFERLGAAYSLHDIRKPEEARRYEAVRGRRRAPFVVVGSGPLVWMPAEMPELERSGELQRVLDRQREVKKAAAEYARGLLHLRGQKTLARDPLAALAWFQRAAEHGDAKGQCALGSLLMSGEVAPKDADAARHWFEAAAKQGSTSAQLALGQLAFEHAVRHRTTPPTREGAAALAAAVAHFQAAADAGKAQAWVWLARAAELQHKLGRRAGKHAGTPVGADGTVATARQHAEIEAFCRMAAEAGNPEGEFMLARVLCDGKLPPQAGAALTNEARSLIESAAQRGYAAAMHVLGCALRQGPSPDPEAALSWWQRGANGGNAAARAALAQVLFERASAAAAMGSPGAEVDAELVRARQLFERAVAQGEGAGMVGLGDCHYFGRGGVLAEPLVAFAWYTVAAKHGCERGKIEARAMRMELDAAAVRRAQPVERVLWATLGHGGGLYGHARACYKEGRASGDETRLRWAAQVLEHAVRRGELRAMPMLARMHLEGIGVPVSEERAVALLQRACQLGSAAAAWALARVQWEKYGDLERAYQWFCVAEAFKCEQPPPFAQLADCLGAKHAASAERRAQRWLQKNVEPSLYGTVGDVQAARVAAPAPALSRVPSYAPPGVAAAGPLHVAAEGSEHGPEPSAIAGVLTAPIASATVAAAPVVPAAVPADDEYYDGSYYTEVGDEVAGGGGAPTAGAAVAADTGGSAPGGLPHDDGGSSYYGSYYSEEGEGGEAPDDKYDGEYSYYSEPDGEGDEEVKARAAPPATLATSPRPARAPARRCTGGRRPAVGRPIRLLRGRRAGRACVTALARWRRVSAQVSFDLSPHPAWRARDNGAACDCERDDIVVECGQVWSGVSNTKQRCTCTCMLSCRTTPGPRVPNLLRPSQSAPPETPEPCPICADSTTGSDLLGQSSKTSQPAEASMPTALLGFRS